MSDKPYSFYVRMPQSLGKNLQEASERNDRSINSEIVTRLRKSFLQEEARRIQWALDHINHGERARTGLMTLSMLAEQAGETSPARLEAIMNGFERPTFKLLEALSVVLNVSSEWMKHGNGTPLSSAER